MLKPSFARTAPANVENPGKRWVKHSALHVLYCAVVKAAMALGASVFAFTHELL